MPFVLPSQYRRPVVVGVLNVTPDSFSDGGRYPDMTAAVEHALWMSANGADLIDVGGESTRPGAPRVPAATEASRVLPVIDALAGAGVATSIDTTRAVVAAAALSAGAVVVNDVSGGLADPAMVQIVADAKCPWVLMHWRAHSADMQRFAAYDDVIKEVVDELLTRVDAATSAGVDPEMIILDPGLGFAKLPEHNWRLSAHLADLVSLGFPVLVGPSRKSYLGALLADDAGPRPPRDRDAATLAASLLAVQAGAWGVRVHDGRGTVDAIKVWQAVQAHR
jgi:dihydropteroate synthase